MYLCIRLLCAKVVGRQPPNEDAGNEANEEDFHRFIPPKHPFFYVHETHFLPVFSLLLLSLHCVCR